MKVILKKMVEYSDDIYGIISLCQITRGLTVSVAIKAKHHKISQGLILLYLHVKILGNNTGADM